MSFLYKVANWKIILPLFILFLSFSLYFFPKYQAIINNESGKELQILDLRPKYSPQEVQQLFNDMGESGREAYKTVASKVDMAYPIVYGSLLILLIVAKIKKLNKPAYLYLISLPILVVLFDFVENYNTLHLLNTYPNLDEQLIKINSVITGIKWLFVVLSLAALIIVNIISIKVKTKNR